MIRVVLPAHLRALARVDGEVPGFYACSEDLSHDPPDDPLPPRVLSGDEPLLVIGAMAGG